MGDSVLERSKIDIQQVDVFTPPDNLMNKFDITMSFGLVEHFENLEGVIRAKKNLTMPEGVVLTVIPNIGSSFYSFLCKRWSEKVYNIHIPYDLDALREGHLIAGLEVKDAGLLGVIEVDLLASTMDPSESSRFSKVIFYKWLSRISKAIHFWERYCFRLPTTKLFSPYLYVIGINKG